MEKICLNSREAAAAIGISLPTFYELSNRADFPRIKVGRRTLVPVDALKSWLAAEAGKHDPVL